MEIEFETRPLTLEENTRLNNLVERARGIHDELQEMYSPDMELDTKAQILASMQALDMVKVGLTIAVMKPFRISLTPVKSPIEILHKVEADDCV